MMNKNASGSRGSTPPTPGNDLDDEERKIQTMVTTPQVAKEKKRLMFKKVNS
jgi:hypothetical protein